MTTEPKPEVKQVAMCQKIVLRHFNLRRRCLLAAGHAGQCR